MIASANGVPPRQAARATGTKLADQSLPAALEAERTILGQLVLSAANGDSSCPEKAFALLSDADFSCVDNAAIFAAARQVHSEGLALEPQIIARRVRGHVEGADGLIAETMLEAVTTATVSYYCELVKSAARERHLLLAVNDASDLKSRTASQAIADLRHRLDAIEPSSQPETTERMFDRWSESIIEREKPKLYTCAAYGSGLSEIPIGDGLVSVFAAAPAVGKTALVSQLEFDALQTPGQEQVRCLFANCEMSPQAILDRQLARLTGVGHQWIRHRDYEASASERLQLGINELRALLPRIEFMTPPFTLERLAERAASFDANIVSVDYLQRFDYSQRSSDQRAQCSAAMDACRRIADQGRAVIVVSAVNRGGYSKDSAGLASFRESSELEYGADAAYLLVPDEQARETLTLKCVKNRHGQLSDIPLLFDGSRQHFSDDRRSEVWTG